LEQQHLALKKPGLGMPPARLAEVIGKRLKKTVKTDECLREEDLA
jgi:sialic acid synthase SpsE